METDDIMAKYLKSKRNGHEAMAVGVRHVAYDCERDPEGARRDAETLDALLAEGADAERIDRLISQAADAGRLPAVLARMLRLHALFAPRRIVEMSRQSVRFLKAVRSHVSRVYTASVNEPRGKLAELAKTLESVRAALLSGSPPAVLAAKAAVKSNYFPAALFFDEETIARCLDAGIADPMLLRRVPRELFALLMGSDRLCRKQKAALFTFAHPYRLSVEYPSNLFRCQGFLFGRRALFCDWISGLSRPTRGDDRDESPDYPMAVNPGLQKAFSDSEFVRRAYIVNKMPEYEMVEASFQEFGFRPDYRPRGGEVFQILRHADDSNPAYFKLMIDLSGLNLGSVRAIIALLGAGHAKALAYIVKEHFGMLGGCLSPEQLLFHSATLSNWDDACELAQAVESAAPGTAAKAIDPFGNTPIWYTLYNRGAREGMSRYAAVLCSLGCDPDRTNLLGLSARDVGAAG